MDAEFTFHSGDHEVDDEWDTENDLSDLEFDLQIGYTFIDNLEVGVALGIGKETLTTKNEFFEMETGENLMSVLLFTRYFFAPEKKLRPFVGAGGGIGSVTTTQTGAEDIKYGMTIFGGMAGVVYFINEHWGLEFMGHYNMITMNEDDDNDFSADITGSQLRFAFGAIISF